MSDLEIIRVDPADDDRLSAAYRVHSAGLAFGRPEAPVWTEAEFFGVRRTPDEAELQELYLATDGDRAVGDLTIFLPQLDNVEKAYADVVVHPEHRGRGAGTALLASYEERARAHDRTELLVGSRLPFAEVDTHPYRRFAEAHGYALANIEVVRHQQAPVADDRLDGWAALAATKAAGYEITTYVDEFPGGLAPSLCTLLGQLAVDAPTGDVDFEEEVMTPERLRHRQELVTAMGRRLFETVAVRDGVVAAQTTLSVPLSGPDASQWGTFVHREHRGHSLGLAVKVANQRAMQAAHPHIRRVSTQNAETNRWMIAINELMGFEPVEAACEFVKRI